MYILTNFGGNFLSKLVAPPLNDEVRGVAKSKFGSGKMVQPS